MEVYVIPAAPDPLLGAALGALMVVALLRALIVVAVWIWRARW